MFRRLREWRLVTTLRLGFILMSLTACAAAASDFSLRNSTVVVDSAEASYVQYTIEELRAQIKSLTGTAPFLSYDLKEARQMSETLIVVGRPMVMQLAQQGEGVPQITDQEPGTQGFVLKSMQVAGHNPLILAVGSDSAGTNYALMTLRQLLTESSSGLGVSSSLDMREKPKYKTRGLYLHQHWRYNNPYATWSWSVQDWKHALDMVAYLRINLVMLWPHMDMLAAPLSIPERDYLADFREIVEYAHRKRGLEVWMVETPNGTLDDPEAKRLPLERRDFYAYLHRDGKTKDGRSYGPGTGLKDPGSPQGFAALMANREALYRSVPNADAYGFIDADTGGWPGSPSSAFVDLFVGNRKLLDQYHERPQQAALFYWLAFSWGTGTPEDNFRSTLDGFSKRLTGTWELLGGPLKIVRDLNYLDRTMMFPYAQVEVEPTIPLTFINFRQLEQTFQTVAVTKPGKGVMVNVQTLLVQLPNLFYFAGFPWRRETQGADDQAVLNSLARLLFPEKAETLANAWAQLTLPGSKPALRAAEGVEAVLKSKSRVRVGTLGSYVFPEPAQILCDLATTLRIHASAEEVRERMMAGAAEATATQAMVGYFREMLDWQKQTGFFGTYGVNKQVIFDFFDIGPDAKTVETAWGQYTKERSDREKLKSKIVGLLSATDYEDSIIRSMTGQVFGTYQVKGENAMDVP
jgi:hypothetical protein